MESEDDDCSDWFVERGFLLEPISPILAKLLGVGTTQIVLLHHQDDCSRKAYHEMRSRVHFVGLFEEGQLPQDGRIIRVYGLVNYSLLERLARDLMNTFGGSTQLLVASKHPIYSRLV